MTPATPVAAEVETGVTRLESLAQRVPELAGAAAFYRAAIPALWQARQAVPAFTLDPARAQQKVASGRPLLVDEDLPLDGPATTDFFLHLCRIIAQADSGTTDKPQRTRWSLFKRAPAPSNVATPGNGAALRAASGSKPSAARQIHDAVVEGQLDLAEVWAAVATGDAPRLAFVAAELKLDPDLLPILAQNSLRPALHAWADGLNGVVDLDQWRRGRCPMCGNAPALSEIRGKEGERRLRCTLCGAGWYFPRLQCPFCHCREYQSLGYIAVAGEEEKYRLQTCDACRGYIKVVVTYDPLPTTWLAVEDLATLHLDSIAVARGFAHPATWPDL
jgi:hypothetical protein